MFFALTSDNFEFVIAPKIFFVVVFLLEGILKFKILRETKYIKKKLIPVDSGFFFRITLIWGEIMTVISKLTLSSLLVNSCQILSNISTKHNGTP